MNSNLSQACELAVIDSHTGGEPTRVVVGGVPDLGTGPMRERLQRLKAEHDWIRRSLVNEPRGSDVMVGAVLCEPTSPDAAAGVIFFNNVGYLGMCGHGLIGTVVTLRHMNRIQPGVHQLETPVGLVTATLHDDHRVSFENVPSYRYRHDVTVTLADGATLTGDVAWGGNWFFLSGHHGQTIDPAEVDHLTEFAIGLRTALESQGITGEDGAEIDHIELYAPSACPDRSDVRCFVLCPGCAYDRSPCGTGTSAKLACLASEGRLQPGELYRQESIIGSVFEGTYRIENQAIIPTVTGSAYVNAECRILIHPDDPFAIGIPSAGIPGAGPPT